MEREILKGRSSVVLKSQRELPSTSEPRFVPLGHSLRMTTLCALFLIHNLPCLCSMQSSTLDHFYLKAACLKHRLASLLKVAPLFFLHHFGGADVIVLCPFPCILLVVWLIN